MNRLLSKSVASTNLLSRPFNSTSTATIKRSLLSTAKLSASQSRLEQRLLGIQSNLTNLGFRDETLIDIKQVIEDLENTQALKKLEGTSGMSYKAAVQKLYPLYDGLEGVKDSKGSTVTFEQLKAELSDNSVAWKLIEERLTTGKISSLASLDQDQRTLILFSQIYGIGPYRAAEFAAAGAQTLPALLTSSELKLTEPQKSSIEYFEDLKRYVPPAEVELVKYALKELLADHGIKIEYNGYRQEVSNLCPSINLFALHKIFERDSLIEFHQDSMKLILEILQKVDGKRFKIIALAHGTTEFIGLIRLEGASTRFRKFSIRSVPVEDSSPQ